MDRSEETSRGVAACTARVLAQAPGRHVAQEEAEDVLLDHLHQATAKGWLACDAGALRRFGVLLHECLRETVRDERAFEEVHGRLAAYLP